MKSFHLTVGLLLAALCTGCATTPNRPDRIKPLTSTVAAVTAQQPEQLNLPDWLVSPERSQASGCSQERGRPDVAFKIAVSKALAELTRKDQVLIKSRLELTAKRSGSNFSSETTESVVQQTSVTLDGWHLLNRELLVMNQETYLCVRIGRGPTPKKGAQR